MQVPLCGRFFLVLCLLTGGASIIPQSARSQQHRDSSVWLAAEWYYDALPPSFFDPVHLLPSPFREQLLLKRYLRDERFIALRKQLDDTLAVDALFDRAMMLTEGNIRSALFIATVAVMDHRTLGIRVPLLGTMYLPLTLEDESLFRLRRTHLPKKLLSDNPRASDKDKLQHFFGSAFIAYVTNSDRTGEWLGDLLETGEQHFVQGGRNDERDKRANALGREFGLELLRDPSVLPSDILWGPERLKPSLPQ